MQEYADIYLLHSLFTCFGCHSTYHQYLTLVFYSMTRTGGCGYSF